MKSFKKSIAVGLIALTGFTATGCFGSFELVRKVYNWNDTVTENKFVKTLLFYGLSIIPVYLLAGVGDFIIFNLIEFWDGSNPLAMNEGECEEEYYTYNGIEYKAVVTRDRMEYTALTGEKAGQVQAMLFDRESMTWYHEVEGNATALMSFEGEHAELLKVYTPNGETLRFVSNPNASGDICDMYMAAPDLRTFALK